MSEIQEALSNLAKALDNEQKRIGTTFEVTGIYSESLDLQTQKKSSRHVIKVVGSLAMFSSF